MVSTHNTTRSLLLKPWSISEFIHDSKVNRIVFPLKLTYFFGLLTRAAAPQALICFEFELNNLPA